MSDQPAVQFIDRRQAPEGNLSTWDKAKDAALIGFLALASIALVKLMIDVSELKTTIAVYQAQQKGLEGEVVRLRVDVDRIRYTQPQIASN